jgi:mono/diheme cytochrome c family protein
MAFALLATTIAAHAGPLKIELPTETATLKKAPGVELATAQCLICHSAEYIATQPPLPRAFWLGSVKKMQEKFGAPIAPGDVEAVVDYLAKNYGAEPAPAAK